MVDSGPHEVGYFQAERAMIEAGQRTVIDELRSQHPGSNGPTEPAGEAAAALEDLRRQILGFERPHGWDGYRARRIAAAACRAAVRFMERVAEGHREIPLPWAAPSTLGAVALHWQSGNNHLIVRIRSAAADRVDV